MKKTGVLLLAFCMALMGSYVFAGTQTKSTQPTELEVELLMELEKTMEEGAEIEEITILSSGDVLVVTSFGNEVMLQTLSTEGEIHISGNAFFSTHWYVGRSILVSEMLEEFQISYGVSSYRFNRELGTETRIRGMDKEVSPIDAKDTTVAYLSRKYLSFNHIVVDASEGDGSAIVWDGKECWIGKLELASMFGWESAADLQGLAFGENENELFFFLKNADGIWTIDKVQVGYTTIQRYLNFKKIETITLAELSADRIPALFDYDNGVFQIVSYPASKDGEELVSEISRYDVKGNFIDSVRIPGQVGDLHVLGNQTAISTRGSDDKARAYMIYWEGKPEVVESPSVGGAPRALIQEKTRSGETTAVFRDGNYGLLKKEDKETGRVEYQAPVRSNASKVKLQIPFADLLSKLGDDRNLTILYGNDQIKISMQALDARELLKQLPCETEATIEIQLIRGEDGTVKVTAELFVVEEVDAKTKRVHRVNLPLS